MKRFLALVFIWTASFHTPAFSADLALEASDWVPFTQGGSSSFLSNVERNIGILDGPTTVLMSNSGMNTGFGFVQKGYATRPLQAKRFLNVTLRSQSSFILYVMVRGSDGTNYYLQYSGENAFRKSTSGNQVYALAPRSYEGGTANEWVSLWFDLASDLKVNVPSVELVGVRWVAFRGDLEIARIQLLSSLPDELAGDADADGLSNEDELWVTGTNPLRIDSDLDGITDPSELRCNTQPLVAEGKSDQSDPDGDGIKNVDEEKLLSCRFERNTPVLTGNWHRYHNPDRGSVIFDPESGNTRIEHAQSNPIAFGVMNPPSANALRLERDQIRTSIRPLFPDEQFFLYVLVEGDDGKLYYLTFPRFGVPSVTPDSWTTYLSTPLEGSLALSFNSALPTEIHLDLTTVMRNFPGFENNYVRHVRWVAFRGRAELGAIRFPPDVIGLNVPLPMEGFAEVSADAGGHFETLCQVGNGLCSEYLWEVLPNDHAPLAIVSGQGTSAVRLAAGVRDQEETHYLRLSVRQVTAQRPEGVWSSATIPLNVLPAQLEIGSVFPDGGVAGDWLTVNGSGFGEFGTAWLGETQLETASWTDSSIAIKIPSGVQPGTQTITIASMQSVSNPYDITVYPHIDAIAIADDLVTITGTNFGDSFGTLFMDHTFHVGWEEWMHTKITFRLWPDDEPGNHFFSIEVGGVLSNAVEVTLAPSVYDVSPREGHGWTLFKVTGQNLGSLAGTVTVDAIEAWVTEWSPTEISFYPPDPMSFEGGLGLVTITASNGTAIQAGDIRILPDLWLVLPESGLAGEVLTLEGGYLTSSPGVVSIGGKEAPIQSWTPNFVTAEIPRDAGPGSKEVVISVEGYASLPLEITVYPALDMPMSPEEEVTGRPGDLVTITGSNLGDVFGVGNQLLINEVEVSPVGWSQTAVSFIVPSWLEGPYHSVHVIANGISSNHSFFRMLPTIASVTPPIATWGETVTITGTGFFEPYRESDMSLTIGDITLSKYEIQEWTDSRIVTQIPFGLPAGSQPVVVTGYGETTNQASVSIRPDIQEVIPAIPEAGKEVRVWGFAFGWEQGNSTLMIGGVEAQVVSWDDWEIVAMAPPSVTGPTALAVTVGGISSEAFSLRILPPIPHIWGAYSVPGETDVSVYIDGENFGTERLPGSRVVIGGIVATVRHWSDTFIEAALPADAPGGEIAVSVIVGWDEEYIVPAETPWTASPSYLQSLWFIANGDAGTISDVHLDLQLDSYVNTWDVILAAPDETGVWVVNAGTSIEKNSTFDEPTPSVESFDFFTDKPVNGVWQLLVTDDRAWYQSGYTVEKAYLRFKAEKSGLQAVARPMWAPPKITAVTPSPVSEGQLLVISGSGFGDWPPEPNHGGVLLGGEYVEWSAWTDTEIQLTLPYYFPSGIFTLQVGYYGYLSATSELLVIGQGPVIFNVTPDHVNAGDTITITGANFGDSQGASTVTVDGVAIPVDEWTDTSITATLPNETSSGFHDLFVQVVPLGPLAPSLYETFGGPIVVPDNGARTSFMEVVDPGPLYEVAVSVDIVQDGNYIGDLRVLLHHPDGTTVRLQEATGEPGGSLVTTFDAFSAPFDSLEMLKGKEMAGVWRLEVLDTYAGRGQGIINGWSLQVYPAGGESYVDYSNPYPLTVFEP